MSPIIYYKGLITGEFFKNLGHFKISHGNQKILNELATGDKKNPLPLPNKLMANSAQKMGLSTQLKSISGISTSVTAGAISLDWTSSRTRLAINILKALSTRDSLSQAVFCNPKPATEKQIITIAVVFKGTGLSKRAINNMPAIDLMFSITPQS